MSASKQWSLTLNRCLLKMGSDSLILALC
ncbi:hypothetical protein AZE42_13635 [Rhizopogon vesiculosus]|uniref:Uncharacterized protein n=1 Tax=Rhizopogon vesiculosus TaxID=180088 RepID=A0A1J8QPV4_9AGAM|nr:hypothetical protein AZE42_13635 [Rhizopogon vesiculosus]